ncbi:MAG: cell division ATP-binding protein FtsE [bacterium]
MIKIEEVSKIYEPNVIALDEVSFHIKPGEFVSLVGQSGTGKTTFVKLLTGEEHATKGKISVGGWDITNIKQRDIPHLRRQIAVIYQDFKLLPKKTLLENVEFALEVCGKPKKKIRSIAPKVMKIVGLENKMDRYPHEVSGGEKQRTAIARSLVYQPKILLADEPTGNLDSINAKEIVELLERINKFGTTVILVTHNKDIVNNLKRRVLTLHDGRLVSDQAIGKYVI